MIKRSNIWLPLIFSLILSMMVCSVIADDKPQAPPDGFRGGGFEHMVTNLTEQGFDVSTIQAAIESGDNETARTLLDAFYVEHPEAKPKRPPMDAEHLKGIIQNLVDKGKDFSAIQAALDSGDTTAAENLLDEFWKNNPDERQNPPNNGEKSPQ